MKLLVLIWLEAATKRDVTSVVPGPMVILNIGPTSDGPEVMRFRFTSDFAIPRLPLIVRLKSFFIFTLEESNNNFINAHSSKKSSLESTFCILTTSML